MNNESAFLHELRIGELDTAPFRQFIGEKVKIVFYDHMSIGLKGRMKNVEGEFITLHDVIVPNSLMPIPAVMISARSIERVYQLNEDDEREESKNG